MEKSVQEVLRHPAVIALLRPPKCRVCLGLLRFRWAVRMRQALFESFRHEPSDGGGGLWPGQAAPTPILTVCSAWPALTSTATQAGSLTQ